MVSLAINIVAFVVCAWAACVVLCLVLSILASLSGK